MNRDQKSREVEVLKKRFQTAKAVIFADNKGLKVSEITALRKKLKGAQATIKTVKNRLVKRALKEASIQGLDDFLQGPTTITSSDVDPVAPAKVLVDFIKEKEAEERKVFVIKGGFLNGEVLTVGKIKALAMLPSKEELYAKLLGCLLNPARGMVQVLAALPRQLVTVVDAIRKQKETQV